MTDSETGGRTVEQEILLKASPERVFQAWTEPADLTRWFTHHSEIDLRPGGALRFSWDDFGILAGRVVAIDPPHRFIFTWIEIPDVGETTIAIDLTPVADGTRLRLVHTGFLAGAEWDRVYRDTVDGWPKELANLRAWLEEGRRRPLPADLARTA